MGAEPDYSTVAEEATAIAEAYAGQIGADDDQVGHRITTALLVTGARDVLADCLQRRDTHTDWDAPLRAHLRNAMPRPF